MYRHFWLIVVLAGVVTLGAACGQITETGLPTPPPAALVAAAPISIQQSGAVRLSPSPTLPPTITPSHTPPPPPPTGTPPPTETPGAYEHVVQTGDDCIGIAYQYGHSDLDVLGLIQSLNNVQCSALQLGATILVPRPTATPTAIGADMTQTAVATNAPPMVTLVAAPSFSIQKYIVQANDTLSKIAIIHDSSLRQICEINPLPDGINCGGCQWESANCCCPNPPVLSEGQEINVPAPTPTPTFTPTLTGSETPTFTPTHRAPLPVYPSQNAHVMGAIRLSWLTVGLLADDEIYLVTLRDDTTGAVFSATTRQLSFDVALDYLPTDGQAHTFVWQVTVVRPGQDGLLYPTGSVVSEQRFIWSGWE